MPHGLFCHATRPLPVRGLTIVAYFQHRGKVGLRPPEHRWPHAFVGRGPASGGVGPWLRRGPLLHF